MRLMCRIILAVALCAAGVAPGAPAAPALRADVLPLVPRPRSLGPMPVELLLTWDGTGLLEGNLELEVEIESDSASVFPLAESLFALGDDLRWLRDPTRGGLATTLNELTEACGLCVLLEEKALPVREQVAAACEILGLDPLYVANEGKLIAVVAPDRAEDALALLRAHPLGAEAAIVGEVEPEPKGLVLLQTAFGGSRVVDMLAGDPLPRIC